MLTRAGRQGKSGHAPLLRVRAAAAMLQECDELFFLPVFSFP